MYGVLVDVSGSMKSAYDLDRSRRVNVERTHAILTTVMNIVEKEVAHHEKQELIFVGAFGLDRTVTETCDLLRLLDYVGDPKTDGHRLLSKLAAQHGAQHAEHWIRNHLSQPEAKMLYKALCSNRTLISQLIELLPSRRSGGALRIAERVRSSIISRYSGMTYLTSNYSEEEVVHRSEAYLFAQKIIDDTLLSIQHPKPRPVQEVSKMLNSLLPSKSLSPDSKPSSLHDEIKKLTESFEPYIFGGTPMCKSLDNAEAVFSKTNMNTTKVLFLLSDGQAADGDPRPIAARLRQFGVTIVTCFLTSDHIENPKSLLDPTSTFQDKGKQSLIEMSSTMPNTYTPVSYLVDAGWELPTSGESCLFIQANSLDVVNEFCEIVVSQLTNKCDALVSILHKVPLATYINQKNTDFEPKLQEGGTCYANAIAAVFHLAMNRIVGREGGIPDFYEIRELVIQKYGVKGADTEKVLSEVCQEYRLHYCKVDETGARKAINERRPVVARFSWCEEQLDRFNTFYENTPKGILNKSDIPTSSKTELGGHAVVLIRCDPKCLTFMNSWDTDWGDGGFFRVKDQTVLQNTTFFDVYWNEDELKPSEIQAYEKECTERAKELLHTFPSIQELRHKCPKCSQWSKVDEYFGHILEAKCPRCHEKFKPTNEEILQSLYNRNFQ